MSKNAYALIAFSEKAGGDLDEDDYLVQQPYQPGPNHKMHLMFGGGHYDGVLPAIGSRYADDSVIDPRSIMYLRKALLKALALPGDVDGLEELTTEYSWSGIMGYSRDNRPWVGEMPGMPDVFIAAGYTGHGLPNGPMCAKALVEMVIEGRRGEELVAEGLLPEDYLMSEERVQKALQQPSLIEEDVNPKGEL